MNTNQQPSNAGGGVDALAVMDAAIEFRRMFTPDKNPAPDLCGAVVVDEADPLVIAKRKKLADLIAARDAIENLIRRASDLAEALDGTSIAPERTRKLIAALASISP